MFWQRVVTILVGMPIVLAAGYAGGPALLALVLLLAALVGWEVADMVRHRGGLGFRWVYMVGGVLLPLALWVGGRHWTEAALVALVALSVYLLVLESSRRGVDLVPLFGTVLGLWVTIYMGWALGILLELRRLSFAALLAGLLIPWAHDIFAYVVGKTLGHRPLVPLVSPGKTVEGTVAGVAASTAVTVILAPKLGVPVAWAVPIGLVAGGAAALGDLGESVLKRAFQVKDAGSLLPGHGGIFDRFDSFLVAVPFIYLVLRIWA